MNLDRLSPPITKMIRADHSHVMLMSHRFTAAASPQRRKAIADTVCLSLEIHAQLEEEIFYPALREVDGGSEALQRAPQQHAEVKRMIDELRGMDPADADFDDRFHALMREVMHHVADEEAELLPAAERLLGERLNELGAQMTRRRLQLGGPRLGEAVVEHARALPGATMLVAGGLLAGAYLLARGGREHRRHH